MENPSTANLQAARTAWQEAERALHEILPPSVRPLGSITDTPAPPMMNAQEVSAAIDLVRNRYNEYLDLLHSLHRSR